MSFIAAAIGAAGVIGGSLLSANGAKGAAAKAADANLRANAETNAMNERLFNLSRGAAGDDGFGHSILPVYFGGNEQDLAKQAYANFNRLNSLGGDTYSSILGYQNNLRPTLNSALGALGDRYNGQDLAQRIGYSNPYFQARTAQAGTYGAGLRDIANANNSAINTGLAQTLAQMNAQRASQGFLGGSTFDRNRTLAATLAARQNAAVQTAQANAGANNALADANTNNANDLRALQLSDLDFRANPELLNAALSTSANFEGLPANFLAQSFNNSMSPLSFFRISPQAFQNMPAPTQEPALNNSQIFGSALSQGASTFANYALMNKLAGAYGGGVGVNPYTTSGAYGTSSLSSQPSFLNGASVFSAPTGTSFGNYASTPNMFNYSFIR